MSFLPKDKIKIKVIYILKIFDVYVLISDKKLCPYCQHPLYEF